MVDLEKRIDELSQAVDVLTKKNASLEAEVARLRPRTAPYIPQFCELGEDVDIAPNAVLMAPNEERVISIGDRTKVLRDAEWIGPITIGSGCYFNKGSYVRANVTVGDNVNVGPFTKFITDSHVVGSQQRRAGANSFPPIVVGSGTWIGAGCIITGGVTIGEGAIVAAGAVVTSDVASNTMVGGIPAKKIKDLDR